MKKEITRRGVLKGGLIGGAGALVAWPGLARAAGAEGAPEACFTICNHWSYIGIGWQLGIESCVLSVMDAIELADRAPHIKVCLEEDARAYEFMAEKFPEVIEKLKKYLAANKTEIIGATYGQPMGTTVSGEANIRQLVVGLGLIRKTLGCAVTTLLEEEEHTHPQMPQLCKLTGIRYASLNQLDTWGRAGCPKMDVNVLNWKGLDGTTILATPKTGLFHIGPQNDKTLAENAEFKKLSALGKPLLIQWEEFGWESQEHPRYLDAPKEYGQLTRQECVTLTEYLDKYGSQAKEPVYLAMDDWDKSLTWGLGGDQLRVMDRKVDALLLAAELFDAVAASLGRASQVEPLDKAWRDLMASQSHDVGLCEYSRWQMDNLAPYDRVEDKHNFTWGAIGYNHLDAAEKQGQAVLDGALRHISEKVNSAAAKQGERAVTVFNPRGWRRSEVTTTGRVYPVPPNTRDVIVKGAKGQVVPSQLVTTSVKTGDQPEVVNVALLAKDVPSAGYDTYYLQFSPESAKPIEAGLKIDEAKLTLENEFVRVGLDPTTGGVASLVEKSTGREMLDSSKGAFPRLTGRPNPNLSLRPDPPAMYDSAKSKANIDWLAKGPLFATVRAQHSWKYMRFETRVTLAVGQPYVEVASRMFAQLPPHSDPWPPANIQVGYWYSFQPNFAVKRVLRDFPFGIEETKKPAFHALTFADLLGDNGGLLVLHPGTQWFRKEEGGGFGNLVMREWESHFTREYGWPFYSEYRHALMPHDGKLSNSERLRAVAVFTRPLTCFVGEPKSGELPLSKSFLEVSPGGPMLSAFRKEAADGYELRLVEMDGKPGEATVTVNLPASKAVDTDLLGNKLADAALSGGKLKVTAEPWKIRNFHVE
jgi:alpha-mannosidase